MKDIVRYAFRPPTRWIVAAAILLTGVASAFAAPPPVVTGVKAESDHPHQVLLSWEKSPDETVAGYEIYRTEEGVAVRTLVGTVSGRKTTTFTDGDKGKRSAAAATLKDGTSYTYDICAVTRANERSAPSEPATATTRRAPASPSGLTATTQRARAVHVQWQPGLESNLVAYVVESSDSSTGPFHKMTKVPVDQANLVVVDNKVPNGATRYYRVKAIDRDKLESPWSEVAAGAAKPLPNAPAALNVEVQGKALVLTWMPPPQPDIKKYNVWKKNQERWNLIATVDMPTCTIPRGERGQKLTLAVSAVDRDGLESPRGQDMTY